MKFEFFMISIGINQNYIGLCVGFKSRSIFSARNAAYFPSVCDYTGLYLTVPPPSVGRQLAKDYLKLQTEVTLLNTKKKQLEERLHRTASERHSRDTPKYVSDLVKLQDENVSTTAAAAAPPAPRRSSRPEGTETRSEM